MINKPVTTMNKVRSDAYAKARKVTCTHVTLHDSWSVSLAIDACKSLNPNVVLIGYNPLGNSPIASAENYPSLQPRVSGG